ncbi:hypothetical protein BK662_07240 [Pseudomonas frederiksbergensis]|uniref:Uncharacterized protein n=1 Tax=Pseudomonas frederiksbergensis TaxID=104087 RepID=A0A423HVV0_9PSED|nr:hypothetical protein BK662_07240 [Pseudomonas frederiksbergensis]
MRQQLIFMLHDRTLFGALNLGGLRQGCARDQPIECVVLVAAEQGFAVDLHRADLPEEAIDSGFYCGAIGQGCLLAELIGSGATELKPPALTIRHGYIDC